MAVGFDAATACGDATPGTSSTFAHTCGATATVIVVSGGDLSITDVTYDGSALTLLNISSSLSQWYRAGPSVGAHNVVVTHANDNMVGGAVSLNGSLTTSLAIGGTASQSVLNKATGSAVVVAISDGSMIVGAIDKNNSNAITQAGGGNQTGRYADSPFGNDLSGYASTKSVAVAGASTMAWSWTGATTNRVAVVEIRSTATVVEVGGGSNSKNLLLLFVG